MNLIVKWLCKDMRPILILEDPTFVELLAFGPSNCFNLQFSCLFRKHSITGSNDPVQAKQRSSRDSSLSVRNLLEDLQYRQESALERYCSDRVATGAKI